MESPLEIPTANPAIIESPQPTVLTVSSFGTFTSNSSGESFTAYSYDMRVSTISMDGELLGYRTLSFVAPDDPLGLNAQIIAMTLSKDKNGDVVFPWGYKDELWKGL